MRTLRGVGFFIFGALDTHLFTECQNEVKCFRCNEEHDAMSKYCSKYQIEKEIVNLAQKRNIEFKEARKLAEVEGITYADVAKRKVSPAGNVKQVTGKVRSFENVGIVNYDRDSLLKIIEDKNKVIEDLICKINDNEIKINTLIKKNEESLDVLKKFNDLLLDKIKYLNQKVKRYENPLLNIVADNDAADIHSESIFNDVDIPNVDWGDREE